MTTEFVGILIIIMIVSSLGLVVFGYRRSSAQAVVEERLTHYGQHGISSLEEIELQEPFQDRVLLPIARRLSRIAARFTPRHTVEKVRQDLVEAGSPSGIGAAEYLGIRVLAGLGLSGMVFVLMLLSDSSPLVIILFPGITGLVGYMLPNFWLKRRIGERKREVQRALPDAIDLLAISVESGLGFDPALARVVEKWDNELTREFGRMLSEVRMGQSRREAMRDMAKRINVEDLNVFASSLIQADQLGVPISQVLRVQSQQMRQKRRQRAEEQAHKAPIKMLFPMVFLIFPSIYIILLGPAIPRFIEAFR